MKNNIDFLFNSQKFEALLSDIEHQRIGKQAKFTQNSKDNKDSRKAFVFGFLGITGCFTLLLPIFFVLLVVIVLSSTVIGMGLMIVLGFAFIAVAATVTILVLRKRAKTILRTDKENYSLTKEYRLLVKEVLLKEIIKSFNDSFEYFPNQGISSQRFYGMQLYSDSLLSSYKAEDYIKGTVGNTAIELCEFSIGKVSGLFLIAQFNKAFHGTTKVLIKKTKSLKVDASEILDGEIGLSIEGNYSDYIAKRDYYDNQPLQVVLLEDPVFNATFDVFSSDQIEARYILSNSLMERILKFKATYDYDLNLVFHESQLYFTINWGANMLEPYGLETSLKETQLQLIQNTHNELSHCLSLIEALNMNSNLWYRP